MAAPHPLLSLTRMSPTASDSQSTSYMEGNFRGNQLLDGSLCFSQGMVPGNPQAPRRDPLVAHWGQSTRPHLRPVSGGRGGGGAVALWEERPGPSKTDVPGGGSPLGGHCRGGRREGGEHGDGLLPCPGIGEHIWRLLGAVTRWGGGGDVGRAEPPSPSRPAPPPRQSWGQSPCTSVMEIPQAAAGRRRVGSPPLTPPPALPATSGEEGRPGTEEWRRVRRNRSGKEPPDLPLGRPTTGLNPAGDCADLAC
ncbi:basic salivary proline-rich protein 3-like [Canis lupus familiaris]|uniref:basic salivary proline-rich protein 3-like n=1 Tax=Canis lupus familiaris TaxID=9615 RepID=UPI0018F51653|nr:basic salivary proline-rich protein 3-like [Canis lupus familiaris]